MHTKSLFVAALAAIVSAKEIVVTVGGNTSDNAGAVFQPQRIVAALGDTITFNFTQGNHTVIQSTFASPCIPAHDTDITINGFNSGFRNTINGTAGTILSVPMLPQNYNLTMWFYDYNTCGLGGVGAINNNESSYETLDGFVRNAERLNGTDPDSSGDSSSFGPSQSSTGVSPSSTSSGNSSGNGAQSAMSSASMGLAALPLLLAVLVL